MQMSSELAEFRASRSAQDAAQAAMIRSAGNWRSDLRAAPVLSDLRRYGTGESLAQMPALSGLFTGRKTARSFVQAFLAQAAKVMARTPMGQPCFRHSCEGGYTLVHLANSARATLSLVVVEGDGGAKRAIPGSAVFTAAERHEAVLAGRPQGEIAVLDGDRLERTTRDFTPGEVLDLPAWSTRIFHRVDASLVCLRLARTPERMPATRQVRLDDAALQHEAAGDPHDTRHELMAAMLAAMEREDAAPALAQIAGAEGHGPTRWQAIKSALALDTEAGFAALTRLAVDQDDPLHGDASSLRAALVARHPVLGQLEHT